MKHQSFPRTPANKSQRGFKEFSAQELDELHTYRLKHLISEMKKQNASKEVLGFVYGFRGQRMFYTKLGTDLLRRKENTEVP